MTQLASCNESEETEHEWQRSGLCHLFFPLIFRGQTLLQRASLQTNMQEGREETGKLHEFDLMLSVRVSLGEM